jgi:hypothetical protein
MIAVRKQRWYERALHAIEQRIDLGAVGGVAALCLCWVVVAMVVLGIRACVGVWDA